MKRGREEFNQRRMMEVERGRRGLEEFSRRGLLPSGDNQMRHKSWRAGLPGDNVGQVRVQWDKALSEATAPQECIDSLHSGG